MVRSYPCLSGTFGWINGAVGSPVTFSLEMDQDPATQRWNISPPFGHHSVANGILTIQPGTSFHAPNEVIQAVNNGDGWSIDARFRFSVIDGAVIGFWVQDHTEANEVVIGSTYVSVFESDGYERFPVSIDSNYHIYRLEAVRNTIRMFIDGVKIFDFERMHWLGSVSIAFNCGYGAPPSEWDYYRFTNVVPEPRLASLMVVAGLLGMTRKSKRG
jgi:hypothetical protein